MAFPLVAAASARAVPWVTRGVGALSRLGASTARVATGKVATGAMLGYSSHELIDGLRGRENLDHSLPERADAARDCQEVSQAVIFTVDTLQRFGLRGPDALMFLRGLGELLIDPNLLDVVTQRRAYYG